MTDTWTFFGRVHPERVPVSWGAPLEGVITLPITEDELKFRTIIHASQVIVDLTPLKGAPDVDTLRNIAVHCAAGITDLVGYTSGNSFTVEIISAINRSTMNGEFSEYKSRCLWPATIRFGRPKLTESFWSKLPLRQAPQWYWPIFRVRCETLLVQDSIATGNRGHDAIDEDRAGREK
jgi:hypothetical protein